MRPALLPVILPALFLAACAAGPGGGSASATGPLAGAEAAYAAGDFAAARVAFEQLAREELPRRDHWLLRAADAAFQAGDTAATVRLLADTDPARLGATELALATLLSVAVRGDELPTHQRLARLDLEAEDLDPSYRPLLHELRAELLFETGQPYASARERLRLAGYLLDPRAAEANRREIFRALQQLTGEQARALMRLHRPEDPMLGWLDLVASARDAVFSGRSLEAAVADWEGRYPAHPAGREITGLILTEYDRGFTPPRFVALLLPEAGPLRVAARAVRDGFAHAYLAAGAPGELRSYDSGSTPAAAVAAYGRALADGATAIVGPLAREAVEAVLLEADGSTPLLALNYAEQDTPGIPGTYQFGLLPEAEAEAAAERMLQDGHDRAIVLTAGSAWGKRVGDAFLDRYLELGGIVFATTTYPESAGDYGAMLQRMLGINAGLGRRRALQADLGIRVGYEPAPRQDLDALFLGARPREGRLIKPQLAFEGAGDLPVYATSHVYSGSTERNVDRDLNGIAFCDAPWLIGSQVFQLDLEEARRLYPSAAGSGARLFALGVDSYRLLPYLQWLGRFRDDHFPGLTGQLAVADRGRIRRRPDCGRFEGGEPRPLAPAAVAEVEGA